MQKVLVLFVLFFGAGSAFAFNWDECKKIYNPSGAGAGGKLLVFTFQISTETTSQSGSSTTSYVSSTGKCSALAPDKSEQSKAFFFENYEEIKADAARGEGEYLISFVSLLGCNKMESTNLIKSLQMGYSSVYSGDDIPVAYENMEHLTFTHCQPLQW